VTLTGLQEGVDRILEGGGSDEEILQGVVEALEQLVEHYSWVGIYLVEGADLVIVCVPVGQCGEVAAEIGATVGRVSVLVNNAGINRRNAFTAAPEAVVKDWQDIMAVNLNGVFNVTHAFLGQLRATRGRIVNIGSIQSFVHVRTPNSPAYTTSKHGVLGLTRALAAELGKDGVRVNAIGPGLIETPLNEKARANNPELVRIFLDHTPLGRTGKPEDIVGPAIFLACDLSAYVTGAIIMADGGYRSI